MIFFHEKNPKQFKIELQITPKHKGDVTHFFRKLRYWTRSSTVIVTRNCVLNFDTFNKKLSPRSQQFSGLCLHFSRQFFSFSAGDGGDQRRLQPLRPGSGHRGERHGQLGGRGRSQLHHRRHAGPQGIRGGGGVGLFLDSSVADPGCLSLIRLFSILDPGSELSPSRIPDPHQRI